MPKVSRGLIIKISIATLAVLVIGGVALVYRSEKVEAPEVPIAEAPVACTMDARQCPDGSYVGRTGPNCEFVCPKVTQTKRSINYEEIVSNQYGGLDTKAEYVIRNNEEWKKIWEKINLGKNPQPNFENFDFTNRIIIAIFAGRFSSGGSVIKVEKIEDIGEKIVVEILKVSPGYGCNSSMAISNPYFIFSIENLNKEIIFETKTLSEKCID